MLDMFKWLKIVVIIHKKNSLTILHIQLREHSVETEYNSMLTQQPIKFTHVIKHHLLLLINVGNKELSVMILDSQ